MQFTKQFSILWGFKMTVTFVTFQSVKTTKNICKICLNLLKYVDFSNPRFITHHYLTCKNGSSCDCILKSFRDMLKSSYILVLNKLDSLYLHL